MSKAESAKQTINALNPDVQVRIYNERLTVDNVMSIFQDYDIIVDGCDNFPTRYLVNDAAFFAGKPVVHGSIFQFEGQASVFKPRLAHATAACSPHHLRRVWCRREVRPVSWEFCPGLLE